MRIELRDESRRHIGRIEVDPALRPTRVSVLGGDREVFLNWEASLDDSGRLRRCVACGCSDMFMQKVFPQITGLVVVLAFAGAAVGALGIAEPPVLIAMCGLLVLDVAILLFSRKRLICYRCGTSYHGLPIARYHRAWDRALADRYARTRSLPKEPEAQAPSQAPNRARTVA